MTAPTERPIVAVAVEHLRTGDVVAVDVAGRWFIGTIVARTVDRSTVSMDVALHCAHDMAGGCPAHPCPMIAEFRGMSHGKRVARVVL